MGAATGLLDEWMTAMAMSDPWMTAETRSSHPVPVRFLRWLWQAPCHPVFKKPVEAPLSTSGAQDDLCSSLGCRSASERPSARVTGTAVNCQQSSPGRHKYVGQFP